MALALSPRATSARRHPYRRSSASYVEDEEVEEDLEEQEGEEMEDSAGRGRQRGAGTREQAAGQRQGVRRASAGASSSAGSRWICGFCAMPSEAEDPTNKTYAYAWMGSMLGQNYS